MLATRHLSAESVYEFVWALAKNLQQHGHILAHLWAAGSALEARVRRAFYETMGPSAPAPCSLARLTLLGFPMLARAC